jgi:hypothetical protein
MVHIYFCIYANNQYVIRGWNVPLIHAIFVKEEAEIICNIPLSRFDHPDKLN